MVLHGDIEHLLHTVNVAGEAGDDDPALRGFEHPPKHRGYLALGGNEARNFGIRRVGHQQVDAFGAEPGEATEVGQPAVERQLVHLEVAGVQHQTGGCANRHR